MCREHPGPSATASELPGPGSVIAVTGAVLYGGVFAYLVTRTNLPFKKYLSAIFIPGVICYLHVWLLMKLHLPELLPNR